MCGVEIVPAHLIDADGALRLELGIYAGFQEPGQHQLVREECSRVPEIEDQRMAERNWPFIIGCVARQDLKQLLVAITGGVEIVANLAAFRFWIAAIKARSAEQW